MIRCISLLKKRQGCLFLSKNIHLLRNIRQPRIILESHKLSRRLLPRYHQLFKSTKRTYLSFRKEKKCYSLSQIKGIFPFSRRNALIAVVLGMGAYVTMAQFSESEKISFDVKTNIIKKYVQLQSFLDSSFEKDTIMEFIESYPLSLWVIFGTNLTVFLLWRIPRLHLFMGKHFTNSLNDLRIGRFHTLLTSCFSHQSGTHLMFNTVCLMSIAPFWIQLLGEDKFLSFYMGAGIVSGLTWCTWQGISALFCRIVLRRSISVANNIIHATSLGASGGICGVLALHCLAFPNDLFQVILLPFYSFTAKNCLYALVIFDTCGLVVSLFRNTPVGHAAHLGGVGVGYLYFEHYIRHQNCYLRQRQRNWWRMREQ